MNVANSVTYLSQDFKLQGGKVGNGGSHFNGQRIVGRSVFVEGTGDLIKVAADFPYSAINFPTAGSSSSLTGETVTIGRMVALAMACRINSAWLMS